MVAFERAAIQEGVHIVFLFGKEVLFMQHIEGVTGEEQVTISSELDEEAIEWLHLHEVKAFLKDDETVVIFPCGTKRQEKLPRLSSGVRLMYTLPDGFHVMVYHERYRDIFILFYEKVRKEILWLKE